MSREKANQNKKVYHINQIDRNTELKTIPRGQNYSKSCALYKDAGHSRTNCVWLLQNHGKYPILLTGVTKEKGRNEPQCRLVEWFILVSSFI